MRTMIAVSMECQTLGFSEALTLASHGQIQAIALPLFRLEDVQIKDKILKTLTKCDLWLTNRIPSELSQFTDKSHKVELIRFQGYHPDLCSLKQQSSISLKEKYHSGIIFSAYRKGLPLAEISSLFSRSTFSTLNFQSAFAESLMTLRQSFENQFGAAIARRAIQRLMGEQCFMWTNSHPKPIAQLVQACAFLESRGSPSYFDEIYAPTDHLNYFRWAIYPGICEAHGCNGDFFWLKDGKIYRSPKELARHYYAVYDSNPNIREKKINLVNDLETDFSVIFR